MPRPFLSELARADVAAILSTSKLPWGRQAARQYAALITAAMRLASQQPFGPMSADRSTIAPCVRRLRIEHARRATEGPAVRAAPHVLFYRVAENGRVEIMRVLHDRMEPRRHLRE